MVRWGEVGVGVGVGGDITGGIPEWIATPWVYTVRETDLHGSDQYQSNSIFSVGNLVLYWTF